MTAAHLVESTLLLGMAIAAAHLPRLAARTRYAVVFLALLKFAVPWKWPASNGGTIEIAIPGPIAATSQRLASATPPLWPLILQVIWLSVAAALFLLIVRRARRAVAEALDGAVPAPAREQALVPLRGVVLLRAPGAAAPAAIGIVRPRIVIPASLDLAGDELAAILAHECAHVARRDNLLALIDAALGAALWFHPLVWMARRILARAREEACDEAVVARGGASAEAYLGALAKVCRAAVAPRVAGVSCIVSNTIRERMNAIMNLSRRRPLPHRLVVAAAVALLAAASLLHAQEKPCQYVMKVALGHDSHGNYEFDIAVIDKTTGDTIAHPHLHTPPGVPASITSNDTKPPFKIDVTGDAGGNASARLQILDAAGNVVATSAYKVTNTTTSSKQTHTSSSSGSDTISINLRDADLKDVVTKFAAIANLETRIDADVDGKVNAEFHDVPWDQALKQILFTQGCEFEVDGRTMHVRRIR
jgi:beta-lactamase regulating signal transducer with metallopeptidase domain